MSGVASAGCADAPDKPEQPGEASQAIYNAGDAQDGSGYAQIARAEFEGPCGGTLVASNVVLTAAHCIETGSEPFDDPNPVVISGTSSLNLINLNGLNGEYAQPGDKWGTLVQAMVHPDFLIEREPWNDVGLYVIDPPIDRALMLPRRINLAASASGCSTQFKVFGSYTHDSDCGGTGAAIQYLAGNWGCLSETEIVFSGLAASGGGSYSVVCKGDSGSPILDGAGRVVSVNSVKSGGAVVGPNLGYQPTRDWLEEYALDRDNDDVLAPDDNCDTEYNPGQLDSDQDGIGDLCDVCTHTDQTTDSDSDMDGVIDCLDACPNDPIDPNGQCAQGLEDVDGDADCDGLCDSDDNCPYVPNAFQENRNRLAEIAHQADNVGDACEPVLVPDSDVDQATIIATWGAANSFWMAKYKHVVRDKIWFQPQPSRSAEGDEQVVPAVETHLRFCQNPVTGSQQPACTANQAINESQLELSLASPGDELKIMPYHRVKLWSLPARGATLTRDYSGLFEEQHRWDYQADAAFWDSNGIVDVPAPGSTLPAFSLGPWSGLDGTFWYHAASSAGHPGNDIGTGIHEGALIANTQQLASRYFPINPETVTGSNIFFPVSIAPTSKYFEYKWLIDPPPFRQAIEHVQSGDGAALIQTPGDNFSLLNPDGTAQVITEHLGAGLKQNLLDATLRWVGAAEPSRAIGSADAPIALALDNYGVDLEESVTVSEDELSLLGIGDRAPAPQGFMAFGAAAAWERPTPPPSDAYLPVYSRLLGQVMTVGSIDPISGERMLWRYVLADKEWTPVSLRISLGQPIAATFSHADRALYILDERLVGSVLMRRLIRLDPWHGGHVVLHEARAGTRYNRHWLVDDRDGSILFVASGNTETRGHRIPPDFKPRRVYKSSGRVQMEPLVLGRGYHFVRVVDAQTQVERVAELDDVAASWNDVGKTF